MTTQVALVTGGRQGLGKGIALAIARKGYAVAIMDIVRDDRAQETLAEIAALGVRTHFVEGDLAAIESHENILAEVWSKLGPVSALVNNAGVAARPLTDILDLSPEAFDRNHAVNLRGSFFLTQKAARRMLAEPADGYRSITFICSIAADHVSTDRAQYCVSKAGLSMTAKLYAERCAPHIHVHEVRPGFIRTAMTASAATGKIDRYIEGGDVALRRWGAPEDVGAVTAELACGAMPYLTGQAIYVDGGFHIRVA
jgi:NAD(P)-dependent dehydrogenase (short-subunit alcohol dehydrogenase family)